MQSEIGKVQSQHPLVRVKGKAGKIGGSWLMKDIEGLVKKRGQMLIIGSWDPSSALRKIADVGVHLRWKLGQK